MKNLLDNDSDGKQTKEFVRFGQFVSWTTLVAFGFGGVEIVAFVLFRNHQIGAAGAVTLGYGSCLLVARELLRRSRMKAAVTVSCVGLLVGIVIVALILPIAIPALIILPLVVVALALSYLQGQEIRLLILASWGVGIFIAVLGEVLAPQSGIPTWFSIIFRISSIVTALGLVFLLMWQFASRLNDTLTQTRAINAKLQDEVTERKRAKEAVQKLHDELELEFQQRTTALSQANALLETMLDYVPDQIYFKDAESRFIKNSRSQARALGLSNPSEVVGKTDFDFFPHAQRSYAEEQEIIRSGKPLVDFEEHVIWPDNSQTWISTTKMPLRDQTGQIIGTFGISRDITERKRNEESLQKAKEELEFKVDERTTELKETNAQLQLELNERKQAQEKLRESEERYRRFFENMHETFIVQEVVVDETNKPIDLRYLDINPAAERILGKTRNEIIGRTRSQLTGRHDPEGVEMASRVASTGEPFHMVRHSPGFRGWFESFTYSLGSGIVATLSLDITERKQAEEALTNSEIRYRRLFESAKDGILILDADTGMIVDVNPFLTKLLGYSHDVFLGKTIWELGFFKDIAANKDNFLELQQKEYIRYEDLPLETANGRRINVEFVSNVYLVDHHKVVQCNIRDITERKQAEGKLQASEERLNGIIASAMDAIISVDTEQIVVLFNAAAEKMFGYPAPKALGQPLEYFIPERFRAAHREHIRIFGETGVTNRAMNALGIIFGLRANGEEFPIEASISQIEIDGKKLYTVILRDITEHKRAEERQEFLMSASKALASSLDYETTLTTVAQLAVPKIADWCTVYLIAPDGSIEQVALTHADPDKVKWARELQKRFPPNLNAPRGVAQVIRSGQAEFTPEIPAELLEPLKKDPEMSKLLDELQLTGGMTVPLTLQGRTLGAISFVSAESRLRYTTEDLELAEELARRAALAISNASLFQQVQDELAERKLAEEELKRSNAELEQFAYVASHDLQEPLRAVAGMVQLLGQRYQGKLDERADEYIGHAVEAATRMQRLINDLLDYSRVTRHGNPLEEINAEQCLNIALANLQIAIQESNVQITHDPLPTVMADAGQLIQVLQNLIGNAIKFRGERPLHIHIDAQKIDQAWQFKVSDNGIGIEPQYFERIFLVFQRLHTRREYPGTGIGLALCKKIIERHHGQIWVESQRGQGSTFYFTIPERKLP